MAAVTMESQIWSRMPEELLDYILAFLPLKTLFNLRCTCKRFNSLIFSPSFLSHHPKSTLPSFFLLSHPQFLHHSPLFHSSSATWRLISLSSPSHLLSSSSNGLLCFSLPSPSSFLVSNPLSNSSRVVKFPFYPSSSFHSVSLLAHASYYTILALSNSSVFLYSSATSSWRHFSGFEPILRQTSHQEGAFFDGFVNFTTPEPFSVVGFELETGRWEVRATPEELPLPRELTFVRLVGSGEYCGNNNKLYLVGGIGRHGISRGMKVWELSCGGGGEWVEVGSLPELMSKKFMSVCYHNYEHVYCFYHEGFICVCCYTWPEVLYYKVVRRTWHWIPKCPSLPEKWSCGFRWFSFVPNLRALV